jgi:hypothetical protein
LRIASAGTCFTWSPDDNVYDAVLLWQLIPEVAYRLGATRFVDGERSRSDIRERSDEDLLDRIRGCIQNTSRAYQDTQEGSILLSDEAHGNPSLLAFTRFMQLPSDSVEVEFTTPTASN